MLLLTMEGSVRMSMSGTCRLSSVQQARWRRTVRQRGLDKQKGQGGWKRRRQEKIGSPGDQRRELMPRVLD